MNATPDMQDLMADFADMQPRNAQGRLVGDEHVLVKFFKKAVHSPLQSGEQGRPIFIDLDHILMVIPGDDKIRIDRPVLQEDKDRFPFEWKKYLDHGLVAETGTPLEQWGALTPSLIAEFKYFNINTVEALAELSDTNAAKFAGGAHTLRTRAKQWLKANADSAIVEKQEAELAKRDAEIAELRKLVEEVAQKQKKGAPAAA